MNQRERFESAWVGDLLSLDWCDEDQRYFSQEVQNRWEDFKAGEASGLELAAKACEAQQQEPSVSVPAELVEQCAEAVHDAYLETCAKLGWSVKPENQVPYSDLIESSKELDRASVRATLRVAAAYVRGQSQTAGQCCPMCGSPEVDHCGPHTKYECGSYDYDQRPGTFKESERCNRIRLRIPLPPEPPTC